jgi:hypothetical protein
MGARPSTSSPIKDLTLQAERLAQKLQSVLPLNAYGNQTLIATIRKRYPSMTIVPRLMVTNVYCVGEKNSLMCQVDLQGLVGQPAFLIVPIEQLAFDRRYPIARDIAAFRKCRAEYGAVNVHDVCDRRSCLR